MARLLSMNEHRSKRITIRDGNARQTGWQRVKASSRAEGCLRWVVKVVILPAWRTIDPQPPASPGREDESTKTTWCGTREGVGLGAGASAAPGDARRPGAVLDRRGAAVHSGLRCR